MGAKQSKRSVDISGKEAESGGEVAAAGAGGEGRVEALADVDALKPQANGAPHIHEQTEKEKLDSGTPENEKDATTEKETKEEEGDKGEKEEKIEEKEAPAPVTNGDADAKPGNGDSPAPEEGKKPKKEKVKKKWSLRSFSFSRKEKPKQEKKQKEEEPKTNGEHEKVPEEAAEVTPENAANEVAEEAKPEAVKEDKTPETPVTEPLTNGSSTPESPKEDAAPPAQPEPAPAPARPQPETQPEQLPVNGLSLEEQKSDASEAKSEESKPEEQPAADTTETAPAPEIPVKKEVCVEQMPLESTPPPLPANPPPSSVASFAASTMAPELTEASLANTADLVLTGAGDTPAPAAPTDNTDSNIVTAATELSPPLKEPVDEKPTITETVEQHDEKVIETVQTNPIQPEQAVNIENNVEIVTPELEKPEPQVEKAALEVVAEKVIPEIEKVESEVENVISKTEKLEPEVEKVEPGVEKVEIPVNEVNLEISSNIKQIPEINSGDSIIEALEENKSAPVTASGDDQCPESNVDTFETVKTETISQDIIEVQKSTVDSPEIEMPPAPIPDDLDISDPAVDLSDNTDDLPPPPPVEDFPPVEKITESVIVENIAHETNTNGISEKIEINGLNTEQLNGNVDTEQENVKNKAKDSLGNTIEAAECNGNGADESRQEQSPSGAAPPQPPQPADAPQEPLPVADKLADLIPEIPVVPELNTQTETSSDVAVAN